MIKKVLSNYWREILIIALLIACVTSIRSCNVNADSITVLTHKADSSYLTASYYKNKHGELIGQINTHVLTIADLKKSGAQLGFDNAELKGQVGNLNRLVAHWKGKAGVSDTVKTVVRDTTYVNNSGQSVTNKTFDWHNKWMALDGLIESDSITLFYKYNVDFSLTAYRNPRKGFWKPPGQLVTDIKFSDPNFRVTDFKGFVVTEPRKRWYQTNGAKIGFGILIGGYGVYRISR